MKKLVPCSFAIVALLCLTLLRTNAATSLFQHQRLAFISGINVPQPYALGWFEGTDGRFYVTFAHGQSYGSVIYRMFIHTARTGLVV
jgi:hypothetical protein